MVNVSSLAQTKPPTWLYGEFWSNGKSKFPGVFIDVANPNEAGMQIYAYAKAPAANTYVPLRLAEIRLDAGFPMKLPHRVDSDGSASSNLPHMIGAASSTVLRTIVMDASAPKVFDAVIVTVLV